MSALRQFYHRLRDRLPFAAAVGGGAVGLQVVEDGVLLACPRPDATIEVVELRARERADQQALLSDHVGRERLAGRRAHLVLASSDYQISQVQQLDVPEEELAEALRWELSEQLPFAPEDAVLQVMAMPDAYRSRGIVHLVSASRTRLTEIVQLAEAARLVPASIGITELALRDLVGATVFDERALATLLLVPGAGILNLSRAGTLYLTRQLTVSALSVAPGSMLWQQMVEQVAGHLETSMEFFESQLGQAGVEAALLLAPASHQDALLEALRENVRVPIRPFATADLSAMRLQLPDGAAGLERFAATIAGAWNRVAAT